MSATATLPPPADLAVRTTTVLILDDRPLVRAGVRAALTGAGDAEEIIDGPIADTLELIESHRPQVVVIPLRGVDAGPFRAIATAKAAHDGTQVLVLTDDVSAASLREAIVAGADGLLVTGAPLGELRRAVLESARGQRVVSPEIAVYLVGFSRADGDSPRQADLTPREVDVLRLLADGLTNHQVADRLDLSPRTVKTHVQNLLSKLDVPDRTGAVARGFRLGVLH